MSAKSDFLDRNFYDLSPEQVKFKVKRNMIVLVVESLEESFADPGINGYDMMPELSGLKRKYLSFERRAQVNGSSWTIAALTGIFYGIPLLPLHDGWRDDGRRAYKHFSLFDYFLQGKYNCLYLQGGYIDFCGKFLLFAKYPNVEVIAYDQLKNDTQFKKNDRPYEFGVDDEVMFRRLYRETERLAGCKEPFFITALTLDMHFPAGYLPPGHGKNDPKEYYAEVVRRTDKRISDYVKWVQNSEFGKDTCIVIIGDHLVMDCPFREELNKFNGSRDEISGKRKAYNCFVNPVAAPAQEKRLYSVFDLMPSILHAAGARWKSDRINLGVSLFGKSPTILEQYGIECYEKESLKYSKRYIDGIIFQKYGISQDIK